MRKAAAIAAVWLVMAGQVGAQEGPRFVLYLGSYHRNTYADSLTHDINLGAGASYGFRSGVFVGAGAFLDAGGHLAKVGELGYYHRLNRVVLAGGSVRVQQSATYRRPMLLPVPSVALDAGDFMAHVGYVPKVLGVNNVEMFSVWFSRAF